MLDGMMATVDLELYPTVGIVGGWEGAFAVVWPLSVSHGTEVRATVEGNGTGIRVVWGMPEP